MSYSTDEAEFWEGYHRIKAKPADKKVLEIPIPQRTFTLPVFDRKHVVDLIA